MLPVYDLPLKRIVRVYSVVGCQFIHQMSSQTLNKALPRNLDPVGLRLVFGRFYTNKFDDKPNWWLARNGRRHGAPFLLIQRALDGSLIRELRALKITKKGIQRFRNLISVGATNLVQTTKQRAGPWTITCTHAWTVKPVNTSSRISDLTGQFDNRKKSNVSHPNALNATDYRGTNAKHESLVSDCFQLGVFTRTFLNLRFKGWWRSMLSTSHHHFSLFISLRHHAKHRQ